MKNSLSTKKVRDKNLVRTFYNTELKQASCICPCEIFNHVITHKNKRCISEQSVTKEGSRISEYNREKAVGNFKLVVSYRKSIKET